MKQTLRDYFPIICTKEKILEEIQEKERIKNIYEKWTQEQQEEFLNFCTGIKGVKICLY